MNLAKLIVVVSTIVWGLTPIRQWKTKYFTYFLILGLLDVLLMLLKNMFYIDRLYYYSIGTILLIYPVFNEIKRGYRIWIIVALIIIVSLIALSSSRDTILIHITIHLFIIVSFLKYLIKDFSEFRRIKIFILLLIMFEFSLLLKFFVLYRAWTMGLDYFYMTNIAGILIGLFFLFFNEKNSPVIKV